MNGGVDQIASAVDYVIISLGCIVMIERCEASYRPSMYTRLLPLLLALIPHVFPLPTNPSLGPDPVLLCDGMQVLFVNATPVDLRFYASHNNGSLLLDNYLEFRFFTIIEKQIDAKNTTSRADDTVLRTRAFPTGRDNYVVSYIEGAKIAEDGLPVNQRHYNMQTRLDDGSEMSIHYFSYDRDVNVSFAGLQTYIPKGMIKMAVESSEWHFAGDVATGYLEMHTELHFINLAPRSIPGDTSPVPGVGLYKLEMDHNITVTAQFVKRAITDGIIVDVDHSFAPLIDFSGGTFKVYGIGQTFYMSAFERTLQYDPDFSILLAGYSGSPSNIPINPLLGGSGGSTGARPGTATTGEGQSLTIAPGADISQTTVIAIAVPVVFVVCCVSVVVIIVLKRRSNQQAEINFKKNAVELAPNK
eukprot:TRINITY_DN2724_c0_g1_i7.p1 TRINITY_DN2724_c0_g1~~TRINITY_DN2724_c0_g1_i7.p1  ORF type:complete len:415 (+),score=100.94 TRINITY_DN2724_c0_g1_i7:37-1281(+)